MQRVTSVVLAGLLLLGLAEGFIPSGPVESSRATLRPLQASRRADDQVDRAVVLKQSLAAALTAAALGAGVKGAVAAETTTKVVSKFKVKETEGGVKYVDVVKGEGANPSDGDFVVINYTGYLSDGTIFDGLHAKGKKPLAFKYGAKQVIPGLEEALATMSPGGERQILVPPELAFGEKGVCLEEGKECLVPPNSNVKYDVILKRVAVSPI